MLCKDKEELRPERRVLGAHLHGKGAWTHMCVLLWAGACQRPNIKRIQEHECDGESHGQNGVPSGSGGVAALSPDRTQPEHPHTVIHDWTVVDQS